MIIRKECLGITIKRKSPFNSEVFTVTINEDPENFALYKVLQLDVFEKNIPPVAEVEEPGILEALKSKKKKRDTSEGNE
jgi:hypothetical protein